MTTNVIPVENMRQIPWYCDLVFTRSDEQDAALDGLQQVADERGKVLAIVYVWDAVNYYGVLKETENGN